MVGGGGEGGGGISASEVPGRRVAQSSVSRVS